MPGNSRRLLALLAPVFVFVAGGVATARAGDVGGTVYTAETSSGYVNQYQADTATAPTAPILTFNLDPGTEQSLAVDSEQNLYFADSFSTVALEYAPGTTTPTTSYETMYTPQFTAVHGSTLYVFQGEEDGRQANVLVYQVGGSAPTGALSDPSLQIAQSMTIDGAGNVIVCYAGSDVFSLHFGVFVHGQMPLRKLSLPQLLAVTMAVDKSGNLLIVSPATSNPKLATITVFAPGQTTPARSVTGLPLLNQLSFTADGASFYIANERGSAFGKYAYPSGKFLYSIEDGNASLGFSGVATSPALVPGVWLKH